MAKKAAKKAVTEKVSKKAATKKVAAKRAKKTKVISAPVISAEQRLPEAPVVMGVFNAVAPEFDALSDQAAARARNVQLRLLDKAAGRTTNKRPASYKPAHMLRRQLLPYPSLARQYGADGWGYPQRGVVIVAGDEGTGKTTLVLSDAAHIKLVKHAPVLYLECEGKQMDPDRMLQCMHTNPEIALRLLESISVDECRALPMVIPKIEDWAKTQREGVKNGKDVIVPPLPMDIPLVAIIDPISRLLTEAEAAGHVEWDGIKREKAHELGTGTNLGHAQWFSKASRFLPSFCERYNILCIFVFSATERIEMNAQAAKKTQGMSDWKAALHKMTFIGGKALRALTSQVLLLTLGGYVQDPVTKTLVGKEIRSWMRKASHGSDGKFLRWLLDTRHIDNHTVRLPPPINYSNGLCDAFAETKVLGFRRDDKSGLVGLKDFNLVGLTPDQLNMGVHANPEWLQAAGEALKIPGYVTVLNDIMNPVAKPAEQVDALPIGEDDPEVDVPEQETTEESEDEE